MDGRNFYLTDVELLWLNEVARRHQGGNDTDPCTITAALIDKLPRGFNPDHNISSRLYRSGEITILGLAAVDPSDELAKDADTVIRGVKEILTREPKREEVTADEVAEQTKLPEDRVEFVLMKLAPTGMFHMMSRDWVGIGTAAIILGPPSEFKYRERYLRYDGLDSVLSQALALPAHDAADALWVLEDEESSKQGTAFHLEGYGIITCSHVLDKKPIVYKETNPSKKFRIHLVRQDEEIDLAILRIEGVPLGPALIPGSSTSLRQLTRVYVYGFPDHSPAKTHRVEQGHITAFKKRFGRRFFSVSCTILYGNSGGPVVDEQGRVVGIAARGADSEETKRKTVDHDVIPVEVLDLLLSEAVE
jgi:S1-C subfamily serine protease